MGPGSAVYLAASLSLIWLLHTCACATLDATVIGTVISRLKISSPSPNASERPSSSAAGLQVTVQQMFTNRGERTKEPGAPPLHYTVLRSQCLVSNRFPDFHPAE